MKKTLIISMFAIIGLSVKAQWHQTRLDSGTVTCFAIKGSNIFAGTQKNGVYLSTDNSSNWIKKNKGLLDTDIKSLAIKDTNVFAGTYLNLTTYHVLFSSNNNGTNWKVADNGLPADTLSSTSYGITSITANDSDVFVGTTTFYGIYRSKNNGAIWGWANTGIASNVDANTIMINGSDIYAATSGTSINEVYLSTNNGTGWNLANSGLPANYGVNAFAISDTIIFAGTGGDGIYMSNNKGTNWLAVNNGLPANSSVSDIVTKGGSIFAGTNRGVYTTTNNALPWDSLNTGLNYSNGITALAIKGDTLFAGTGGNGVWIYHLIPVGIKEVNKNVIGISVYPNPATNNFTIESPQSAIIEITNIQGQLVKTFTTTGIQTNIDVSALPSGVYVVEVKTEKGINVQKFIKE
jgi:hypothetical protein